jgi:hypothetical protein
MEKKKAPKKTTKKPAARSVKKSPAPAPTPKAEPKKTAILSFTYLAPDATYTATRTQFVDAGITKEEIEGIVQKKVPGARLLESKLIPYAPGE